MNDILPFLVHHFILSSVFIVLLAAVIYVEMKGNARGVKKISPQEAIHLINREKALVIDLRDKALYTAGHIAGALSMAQSELIGHPKLEGKTAHPLILVCGNGSHSPALATQLYKKGFTQLFYLGGGMTTWTGEHLPVVK
jgi:rhodanese-related sulfurtransferase